MFSEAQIVGEKLVAANLPSMGEGAEQGKEPSDVSRILFLEVLCKSSGKIWRFASGTDAEFALRLINSALGYGVPVALYIESAKEGEETVKFGPKATLVNYGEGWKLQTAIDGDGYLMRRMPKQSPSSMKPLDSKYMAKPPPGSSTMTTFQFIWKILIAFAFMFLLAGTLAFFLENLPWLIKHITSSLEQWFM
ncbi:hypothetical protein HPP92_022911 [Vanilla planifolia]|uniref:Uncharacterized protein n=1 Tax=Vanilla planifolia TaxID=51239 RepID=A0A835PU95_VANPL|nr:hypothetical protein HPP92_022911 [Vanilla planifolia]